MIVPPIGTPLERKADLVGFTGKVLLDRMPAGFFRLTWEGALSAAENSPATKEFTVEVYGLDQLQLLCSDLLDCVEMAIADDIRTTQA